MGGTVMANSQLSTVLRYVCRLTGPGEAHTATDRQLLERYSARRDEAAFEQLVERHGPAVLATCRRVLDVHDAEDAFQATFLVLALKARCVPWQESVGGWLHAVACRIALKARGDNARRRLHESQFSRVPRPEPAPELSVPELRALLDSEVCRLPRHYRQPVILCYLEGNTVEQAARELLCPTGTVKSRLARARDLLRARLSRRGLALSASALSAALAQQSAPA